MTLTSSNPADSDFAGVKNQRRTGSLPALSSDGTTVYNSTGIQHVDNNVSNNQTYSYTAYAYDTSNNFASARLISPLNSPVAVTVRRMTRRCWRGAWNISRSSAVILNHSASMYASSLQACRAWTKGQDS